MPKKREYMIITFQTTTQAMAMESKCEKNGIPGRLIPVPREITAGCGLSWRMPIQSYQEYEEAIDDLGIGYQDKVALML